MRSKHVLPFWLWTHNNVTNYKMNIYLFLVGGDSNKQTTADVDDDDDVPGEFFVRKC